MVNLKRFFFKILNAQLEEIIENLLPSMHVKIDVTPGQHYFHLKEKNPGPNSRFKAKYDERNQALEMSLDLGATKIGLHKNYIGPDDNYTLTLNHAAVYKFEK